jgi:hypothetical protein
MNEERRITDLELYQSYRRLLERPTFNSIEQAEREMRVHDGEFRRFIVRNRGSYSVCTCYIQTDREGNSKWAHREEFSFLHCDMLRIRDRAALAVGRELVESM